MSVRVRSPYRRIDVNDVVPNTVQEVEAEVQTSSKRKKKSDEITESSDSDEAL